MGAGVARRLLRSGFAVSAFDLEPACAPDLAGLSGFARYPSLEELVLRLVRPRVLWLALPSGTPTSTTIDRLAACLERDDVIVDAANSYFLDSAGRALALARAGVQFMDVGLSGGVAGEVEGFSIMVGGDASAVQEIEPLLTALAKGGREGWAHLGPAGFGHYVKMIHNGIEYAVVQAIAEGCALMLSARRYSLDVRRVLEVWSHGSLLEGTLLRLTSQLTLDRDALEGVAPITRDLGTGRWFVKEAIDLGIATPTVAAALGARLGSQDTPALAARLVALLRHTFGGHALEKEPAADSTALAYGSTGSAIQASTESSNEL